MSSNTAREDSSGQQEGRHGLMRSNMEAFGMAILMAVLLKYFAIEAYVIPTPSMQPTMMGEPDAGQRDRILVDKIRYEIVDPERWDVAVFRYPLRQIQSYVKRIVGTGPEQLLIAGGNIYTRALDAEGSGGWKIQRKPDSLQERLWKQIYPGRMEMASDDKVIPSYFRWLGAKFEQQSDGSLTANIGKRTTQLTFLDRRHQGLANHIYDGYPAAVARIIKEHSLAPDPKDKRNDNGKFAVQDARLGFDLTASEVPAQLILEVEVTQSARSFRLIVESGKGRLQVVQTKKGQVPEKVLDASEPFDFPIPAGESVPVRFARVDDQLIAWHDGDIVGRLLCDKHAIRDDLFPNQVKTRVRFKGGGKVRLDNLVVERDLHYTRSGTDIASGEFIKIPADHFFMMGDNTLGSADSRAWKSIKIGIDEDNNIVDPKKHPSAKVIRGNKRPKPLSALPLSDDNPFPSTRNGKHYVAFGDHIGQMYRLHSKVPDYWSVGSNANNKKDDSAEFISPKDGAFVPQEQYERFVPRSHIQGRPLVNFFRSFDSFWFNRWIR